MVMFPIFIGGSSCASGILGLAARANRAPEKAKNPSMVDGVFDILLHPLDAPAHEMLRILPVSITYSTCHVTHVSDTTQVCHVIHF